jgi:hypothetical protein
MFFRMGTKELPRNYELYIADMEAKRIYKTCISTSSGLASSLDGKLLAMIGGHGNPPPVMVLDLDDWALYTVAYHSGSIIGWRGD